MIRVGVFGAGGRMGLTVCRAVIDAPDMQLVAAVDPNQGGVPLRELGVEGSDLAVANEAAELAHADAEVAVDFTVLAAARENLHWCAAAGVHAVVGTTGFDEAELRDLASL